MQEEDLTLLTATEVQQIVTYSISQINRLEKQGLFPRRLRIGPARVAWRRSDIRTWIEQREADS